MAVEAGAVLFEPFFILFSIWEHYLSGIMSAVAFYNNFLIVSAAKYYRRAWRFMAADVWSYLISKSVKVTEFNKELIEFNKELIEFCEILDPGL